MTDNKGYVLDTYTLPADKLLTLHAKYRAYSQGVKYTLSKDGKSYYVSSIGTCKDRDIIIANEYNGLLVVGIGSHAFEGSGINSITIPASVTYISFGAFNYCTVLKSVMFEENSQLKLIDDYAFIRSGIKSITIPASVETIGGEVFMECTELESVVFEKGCKLSYINYYDFAYCTALKSIEIPASVEYIGNDAFYCCASLSIVGLPANINFIDSNAFSNCTNLNTITFMGTVEQWKAVSKLSYWNSGVPATSVQCSNGKVYF